MSIKTSLDSLKRLALQQIMENIGSGINSEHMRNYLSNYIKYGDTSITSLTKIVTPDISNVFASDLSAKVMLAYLELYTHYVISSANSETMEKLNSVSMSKYLYILFKYKEATSIIEEKKILKDYKYVRHINFSAPRYILAAALINSVYNLSNTLQLSYKNMLSLPIMDNKIVYPSDIMVYINDNAVSNLTYTSDNKNVSAAIYRKFGSHIGSVKGSRCINGTSEHNPAILFNGVIGGYISNVIYFKIISINIESNSIKSFVYSTSTNGQDWEYQSDANVIEQGEKYSLYVLSGINTGITFSVQLPNILTDDLIWSLELDYDRLDSPSCSSKFIFNELMPISYLTYNDISEFDLSIIGNAKIKREETGESVGYDVYQNSIENIVPINGLAYSIDITSNQSKSKLASDKYGNLQLRYDFDIADICANSNVYYKTGSILFEKLQVENISTVSLDSEEHIAPKYDQEDMSRTNIFYSIITETDYGISEIPIINSNFYNDNSSFIINGNYMVLEPIVFNDKIVRSFDNIKYNLKNRFGTYFESKLYKFNAYDKYPYGNTKFSLFSITSSGSIVNSNKLININTSEDIGSYYMYLGNIFVGNMLSVNSINLTDGHNWTIMGNKVAYMYYIDSDEKGVKKIRTAIKSIGSLGSGTNLLSQFTGNIYGKVTMLSADESYISPYITKYTLSCI